jgi:thioredoxin 1
MVVRTVTDDNFDAEVLDNPRPVIVEYWAQWCPPCRMLGPVLEEIAREHAATVDVVKLNTDENPRTAQKYGVLAVPTINVFSRGQVVKQVVGAKPKSALLRDFAPFLGPERVAAG